MGLFWDHLLHSEIQFVQLSPPSLPFILVLWELCTKCFDHIHSFPCLRSVPYYPTLYCPNVLGWMMFHWYAVNLPEATLIKKLDSPSPQSYVTNNYLARNGASCPPPISMLGFVLAWVCTGLGHAFTTALCSHVQLPCSVRRTLSFYSSTASGLSSLSAPSSAMILEIWEEGMCYRYSKMIIPLPHSPASQLFMDLHVIHHLLQIEVSWWGLGDDLVYGNGIMVLGLSSVLCHISTDLSAVAQGVSSLPTKGSYNLTFSCFPPELSQSFYSTLGHCIGCLLEPAWYPLFGEGTTVSVVLQPDVDGMYLCF